MHYVGFVTDPPEVLRLPVNVAENRLKVR